MIDTDHPFQPKIDGIADDLVARYRQDADAQHVLDHPMPSECLAERICGLLFQLLFLGYYGDQERPRVDLVGHVRELCGQVFDLLADEIAKAYRHGCREVRKPCCHCRQRGQAQAVLFMEQIGELRRLMQLDVQAAFDGDPAAKSLDEIIFSYPCIRAIATQRIAHVLYQLGVPVLPRIMTEYAHRETGIDIHPGAQIGERFFIDHGTGVVIGETSVIGTNVRLYHGVTLGAFSLPTEEVNELRNRKRHPTIEDNVIVYPNATILGGETVIGRGAVIGGNAWVTHSVAPGTKVTIEKPPLKYKNCDTCPDGPGAGSERRAVACNQ